MATRNPAVAGMFYPGNEDSLNAEVDRLIPKSEEKKKVIAVVSPHAGYIYSGGIAGEVFSSVDITSTVIMLGPNHTGMGERGSIMNEGRWVLPNGTVEIDSFLAEAIMKRSELLKSDSSAHLKEHSLEVQIPFLLHERSDVNIVPITLKGLGLEECRDLGVAIAGAITDTGKDVLIVASSDMTHYESEEVAEKKDKMAIDRIRMLDPEGLYRVVRKNNISMCGVIPSTIMLFAAKEMGAKEASLIRYATSGDVSGDYDQVVGYAGITVQ